MKIASTIWELEIAFVGLCLIWTWNEMFQYVLCVCVCDGSEDCLNQWLNSA